MFGICIESSHARGMGHFFRQLNFSAFLAEKKEPFVFLLNDHPAARRILSENKLPHEIVPLNDLETGWERKVVGKYRITTWVDDRQDTDGRHARFVKDSGAILVVFDNTGSGAALADFNFSALVFDKSAARLPGKKVFAGTEYLILNREIDSFKRLRSKGEKILVTLGGSDTYGVTLKAIDILKSIGRTATVVVGPSFNHRSQVDEAAEGEFEIKSTVKSLIAEMAHYDLAVCGGGITAFEANASGLPCIIIANERFEESHGRYLERLGSSIFAGHHENINQQVFKELPISKLSAMSQTGLTRLDTKGAERIWSTLTNG